MKIRTQYILNTFVFGIILLLASASVLITDQRAWETHEQEVLATQLEQEAYELGYLTNDYLLYGESQQASRWESKFASFSQNLSSLKVDAPEQQALVNNITTNQQRLKAVFAEVRATLERESPGQGAVIAPAFMQVSWSRLEVQNQGIIFDTSRLTRLLREQEDQSTRVAGLLSFVLIAAFGAFLLVNYGLTFRRVLKAIADLQAGTKIIGSGNLDFAIAVKHADEIGELSLAFNRMTSDLKGVTASKAELEREIAERQRVEEALQEAKEHLENRVKERTAELEQANRALQLEIAERKRAEETVKAERQRLYDVLETLPAYAVLLSADYHVPFSNRFFRERFGESHGRCCFEYLFGRSEPCEICESYTVMKTNAPHRWEWIGPDGRNYDVYDFPFTDADGSRLVMEMGLDVTERKQAEAELLRYQEHLEELVKERAAELESRNVQLAARTTELQSANQDLRAARMAALNVMEDALEARKQAEQVNAELVRTSERLRESEEQARNLVKYAPTAIYEMDFPGHRFLSVNDAMCNLSGYTREELLSMSPTSLTDEPGQETFWERVRAKSAGDKVADVVEYKVRTKDGRELIMAMRAGPFAYREGKPEAVLVIAHDITERKRAEQERERLLAQVQETAEQLQMANVRLHEQAEELQVAGEELAAQNDELRAAQETLEAERRRYQELFDFAPGGYLVTDLNGTIREANRAAVGMLGMRADWLVGKPLTVYMSQQEHSSLYARLAELQKTQTAQTWEMRLTPRQDESLPALVDVAPARDAQGQLVGLRWLLRDITERKRAEEEIERLARFPAENPDPVLRLSRDGLILYANEASGPLLREWGCATGECAPADWRDLTSQALASQSNRTVDTECSDRVYSFFIAPIAEADYVNLYGQDITERKRAEETLHRLNRTLKAHSHSDQALMRATTETEYMQQVCKIIVEDCGHAMAWIGFAEEDGEKSVRPVAYAGFEEGYLETLHITWADTERGRGPTGTAVRTGKPSFCRNMLAAPLFTPWRAEALKRGYASSLVLPLLDQGRAFGALTIYFQEPDPFTEDEINLLSGLADDLAYGIRTLQLRAAHARAEAALGQSEERYRSLFEGMTEGFALHEIICDEQGEPCDYRFLEINPAFERLTGLRQEDVVGRTHNEVLPGDSPLWVKIYGQVALTGEPVHLENYSLALKRHYEVFSYCPGPRQFAAVVMDVTERKRVEETLRKLSRAVEQSPTSIVITDTQGAIEYVNPWFTQLTGYSLEEARGQNPRILKSNQTPAETYKQLWDTILAGGQWQGEFCNKKKNGELYWESASISPVTDEAGLITHFVAVKEDITERKNAEEQLARSLAESQEYAERLNIANAQLQERTEELEVTMEELAAQNDELRAARQELETERQRYQELFEFAPGGYLVTDQQGTIRESNRTAAEMLNVQADRLVGKPLTVLTAAEEHGALYARLTQLQIEQYTRQWELALLPRERPSFPALADVTPMRDAEGQLVGFRWLLRDITELRQTQQLLQDSNEQLLSQTKELQTLTKELSKARDELELRVQERTAELAQANAELRRAFAYNRSLIEASLDPLVTIGPDGKITDVNAATELATAYARQELIGTDFSDYFTRPERARAVYQRVFDEGTVRNYELELLHRDGHITSVLYNASVYRDEAGQVIGVFAAARDITKRKLAEEQLRLQSAALEAAANGIIITDVQGNIQWANPAFAQMTGYARGEVLGQATRLLRSGVQSRQDYRQLWDTILSGQVWRGQMVNRRKDGSLYTEEQTIAPVLNAEAEITHFVAIKQDITERKRMEEAERHARQIAETLSAATLALAQTLNLETVMETLLDLVGRLVPYDSANVMLLETESRLAVRVIRGYERWGQVEQVRAVTFDVQANPILNELFTAHKSRLVSDSRALPGWERPPGAEHVRSWIGVPLIADGNIIGVCSLDKAEPGFFTQEHVQSAEMLVGQAAVAIQNAWLFEQVRAGRERLQSLSHRLVEVQEAERRYIARELHDEAGQALTSLIFGLGQLEQSADLAEQSSRIAELKHATNAISESLHQLAMDLRPASLDHLGLVPSLHQYVQTVGDRFSLIAQFKALGFEAERLQPSVETALYRIVQEALTNVVRHARATRVDVLLERRGDKVIVVVEDNGVGFDADTARFAQSGRLGLLGMQERAEMLGGSLVVESSAGAGTTMVVEIPYADSYPHR